MKKLPKYTATIITHGQNVDMRKFSIAGIEYATAYTDPGIRRRIIEVCYAHLMDLIVQGFENEPIRLKLELHEHKVYESTFINDVTPLEAAKSIEGLIDIVFKLLKHKKNQVPA